ncbi:hemerythrin domain-containing protein [Aquabacterium soli]|jgi:hypothetical protein|nr:hemerythrin domain-containing protein [Aquabacterium soli]
MSSHAMSHDFMPPRGESRGPRANTHARSEVLRMLRDDHRTVKSAFREFDRLDSMDDAEACENLIRQTCMDLEIHTRLEEEVFYPAVRAALSTRVLIDDAEVEHQTMNMLLGQVRAAAMGDPRQSASFRVLGEYIRHHVKEEEGEMFRQLSHAKLDWQRLLEDMQERRALLTNEVEDHEGTFYRQGSALGLRQGLNDHGLRPGRHS